MQRSIEIEDEYGQACFEIWLGWTLLLRGRDGAGELAAACLQRSRRIGDPQALCPALVVAAAAAAFEGNQTELGRLLVEMGSALDSLGGELGLVYLPEIIRLAVSTADIELAELLIDTRRTTYPGGLASLASARALVHEAKGDLDLAVSNYADAAQRWTALGHVVEHAHALLGLGRSRLAASDPGGVDDVLAARQIWVDLGAQPLIAQTDALLSAEQRMTS